MSAPLADPSSWLPVAVLGASLAGSLHCVGMCGGLMASVAQGGRARAGYHLGRGIGYSGLGALAGWLGQGALVLGRSQPWISLVSAVFMSALLLAMAYSCWRSRGLHLWKLSPGAYSRLFARKTPLLVGLGTALLPCGWLHLFVVGAAATQSPVRGALYMSLFWAGTLPALAFAQALVRAVIRPVATRAPVVAAVILASAGILNLGVKIRDTGFGGSAAAASHASHAPGAEPAAGHCH